ncbi:BLUF domain-containing protein [Rhodovulum euryhalinum]|uniref:FAD-dependent sensor of blue light n=1 Tax=Rhodovulum euryhalinum TaxID=35805 RepID=A0A4R2KG87_9RHOB|nr:BLUF domain-containing protein [Rhodovulum euryhalinum]TCO69456.1 FAD-dependent sensor of blue light [Rhodovulum euryhalinum]
MLLTEELPARTDETGVFRLAYVSRSCRDLSRSEVEGLAEASAAHNLERGVSGVLIYGHGVFLQWLEGPATEVCALMARIERDPRHAAVTVLSAGWIGRRRFSDWSMRVIGPRAPDGSSLMVPLTAGGSGGPGAEEVARAFDAAARLYLADGLGGPVWDDLAAELVQPLARGGDHDLPPLPEVLRTFPRARAAFADTVCNALAEGWAEDRFSGLEVTMATVRLNRLLLRAGRAAEPVLSRGAVVVLVPEHATEITGAIVKADLLRAAGYSVKFVPSAAAQTLTAVLEATGDCPILVYGGRIGFDAGDARRAGALVTKLVGDRPGRAVLLCGRISGALSEWPDRLEFLTQARAPLPGQGVDWPAVSALAAAPPPVGGR